MSKTTPVPEAYVTYTTLDALDRVLVSVPQRIHDVDIERTPDDSTIITNVSAYDSTKVMCASRVAGDVYNVSFDIYSRVRGAIRYNRTIKFTTTRGWVDQWIEMAQAG